MTYDRGVIVVVGSLAWDAALGRPAGRAAEVAIAAAGRGAEVQVVGRVRDDADGDRLLLELARAGVGHVAVLRSPRSETPLDPGDVALAIRYLLRVDAVVATDDLDPSIAREVIEEAAFVGATPIVISADASIPVPREAFLLEAPGEDADAAFATFVGGLAARLAAGEGADQALLRATEDTGWEPAAS